MLPELHAAQLKSTQLLHELYTWVIPNSRSNVAYLRLSGDIRVAYLRLSGDIRSDLDLLTVYWRTWESCRMTKCEAICLDLRDARFIAGQIDVSRLRSYPLSDFIRVVVSHDAMKPLFINTTADEIHTDFDNAFSQFMTYSPSFRSGRKNSSLDPRQMLGNMEPTSLAISNIRTQCYTWFSHLVSYNFGYIQFSGQYRSGSNGKDDGRWIAWQIDEFCELVHPYSLVIDLLSLDYTWGDDLFVSPTTPLDGLVRVVVPSDRISPFDKVVSKSQLCTDLDVAFRDASTTGPPQ